MEYHLERRVRLGQETEFKSLYSWFLQELSETNEPVGSKQIPWYWSLHFTAEELRYYNNLSIERDEVPADSSLPGVPTKNSESIIAVLHPETRGKDGRLRREVKYSMFGTGRRILDFSLIVQPLSDRSDIGVCEVWGGVSYTAENDFRMETQDDCLQVSMKVSPQRFLALRKTLESSHLVDWVLHLRGVSGFYSEWSPSVSTSSIKVLARDSEQLVERDNESKFEPPRLGHVRELELTTVSRRPMNVTQSTVEAIDSDRIDDEEEQGAQPFRESPPPLTVLSEQLDRDRAALEKLKWPLWFVVLLLVLLYLK